MEIELIDTKDMATADKKVNYSMVSIRHHGYDYVIYTDPKCKDRLYLDVYKGKYAEATSYNGLLPMRRSIIDYLKNKKIQFNPWKWTKKYAAFRTKAGNFYDRSTSFYSIFEKRIC